MNRKGKEQQQQKQNEHDEDKHLENQSVASEALPQQNQSSTKGRFEANYKVGDRAADSSLIREVKEADWESLNEKQLKGIPIISVCFVKSCKVLKE
jgi:hypothetical protein